MRALQYDGKLQFVVDAIRPTVQPGEVLLKIRKAGICNTDMEIVRGYMGFRGIPGHEFVADVVEGDAGWRGQRVVGEINNACGTCDLCAKGVPSQCRNRTTMGIDRHDGAFADFMALTVTNLHAVPGSVTDDAAVFVEPLAAALQVLDVVHISPRDRVLLLGAGKLGMLVAQVLKLTGASLSVIVRHEKQARMLDRWGIQAVQKSALPANQADIVVDCTGNPGGFSDALDLVRPRGTLVLKSTYVGLPEANLTRVVVDEIRVIGSRCGPFDAALRLLERGLVDVLPLIEAHYLFDNALEAFAFAQQQGILKVILDF